MANKEVHIGDDWYLGENNDGDFIFYNSRKNEVVKAIDVITGAEDKKGNPLDRVSSLTSSKSEKALQAHFDGLITPVVAGKGMGDIIDPSKTSTPMQDAIDVVAANGYGAVLAPPEEIHDTGPIEFKDGVSVYGYPKSTVFRVDAGNHGIYINEQILNVEYNGFTIRGSDTGSPPASQANGIEFGASGGLGISHIGKIAIEDFYGRGINIADDCEYLFSVNIDHIHFANIDAGGDAVWYAHNAGGPAVNINHMYIQATDNQSGADPNQLILLGSGATQLEVGVLNIGGVAGNILQNDMSDTFILNHVNYEPTTQHSSPAELFYFYDAIEKAKQEVRFLKTHGSPASPTHIYTMRSFNQNCYMAEPQGSGIATGSIVNFESDVTGARNNFYEGPPTDIDFSNVSAGDLGGVVTGPSNPSSIWNHENLTADTRGANFYKFKLPVGKRIHISAFNVYGSSDEYNSDIRLELQNLTDATQVTYFSGSRGHYGDIVGGSDDEGDEIAIRFFNRTSTQQDLYGSLALELVDA